MNFVETYLSQWIMPLKFLKLHGKMHIFLSWTIKMDISMYHCIEVLGNILESFGRENIMFLLYSLLDGKAAQWYIIHLLNQWQCTLGLWASQC